MGDTGSLTLGYILSFLAIRYCQYTPGAIVIAFSTLIVPAFDVIRVILWRARNGKGLFLPDQNHIHHKFLAMGFTPRQAMITILAVSLIFSVSNILLTPYVNNTILIVTDFVLWIGLNCWWDQIKNVRLKQQNESNSNNVNKSNK